MTTINTIEDLVRILDERPEWNEAIRVRLLSRELLDLPQTLATFTESTEQRLATIERRLTALEEGQARLESALAAFIESTNRRLETLEAGQARVEQDVEDLKAGQARIERDLAPLKAAHARNGALRITRRIARTVNCHQVRLLDGGDVLDDLDDSSVAGIPQNELDSFEVADIIIEGRRRDSGETEYIAVEVSFTADQRDTDRAIRNAGFLTRFTGQPAHAVIASQRFRPAVQHLIDSGAVRWVEIPQEVLETD